MKIGFIFECQPAGPDEMVYRGFIDRLKSEGHLGELEIDTVCQNNLPKLKANCGQAAAAFLASQCDHVFICWDLYPSYDRVRPLCTDQRTDIQTALEAADVPMEKITLICVQRELESWLVADGAAIAELWNQKGTKPRIANIGHPDNHADPKGHLDNIFRTKLRRGQYQAHIHAKRISEIADLKRVAKSQSFCRLVCKLRRLVPGTTQGLCACP